MTKIALSLAALLASALPAVAATCPSPPPPVSELALSRIYSDKAGSVLEPTSIEQHKLETAPLVDFVGFVAKSADKALKKSKTNDADARCGLDWIKVWAAGDAYLGKMETKQAEAQRKWDLAGISLSYLKLKKWATAEDKAAIQPWLIKVADVARAHFNDPGVKRNNHWYWLGLGLGAVGIAADSEPHWQMAKSIFEDAAKDIQADGTLPYELAREGRALHYHAFAVEPLVVLAELAASRGENWYTAGDGALHRLVGATIDGLNDPSIFDKRAFIAQQRPVSPGAGWLALYRAKFPGKIKTTILQPDKHRWLGGDVLELKNALTSLR